MRDLGIRTHRRAVPPRLPGLRRRVPRSARRDADRRRAARRGRARRVRGAVLAAHPLLDRPRADRRVGGVRRRRGGRGRHLDSPARRRDPCSRSGEFFTAITSEGESDMEWTIGDEGFEMKLTAEVPRIVGPRDPGRGAHGARRRRRAFVGGCLGGAPGRSQRARPRTGRARPRRRRDGCLPFGAARVRQHVERHRAVHPAAHPRRRFARATGRRSPACASAPGSRWRPRASPAARRDDGSGWGRAWAGRTEPRTPTSSTRPIRLTRRRA